MGDAGFAVVQLGSREGSDHLDLAEVDEAALRDEPAHRLDDDIAQNGVTSPLLTIAGLFLFVQCSSTSAFMGKKTLHSHRLVTTKSAPSVLASVVLPPVSATAILMRAIVPMKVPQPLQITVMRGDWFSLSPSFVSCHHDCRYSSSGMTVLPSMKLSRMPPRAKKSAWTAT